jgi:hypothetical protein
MSALLPKADIAECDWYLRFVPKADSCSAAKNVAIRSAHNSLPALVGDVSSSPDDLDLNQIAKSCDLFSWLRVSQA